MDDLDTRNAIEEGETEQCAGEDKTQGERQWRKEQGLRMRF